MCQKLGWAWTLAGPPVKSGRPYAALGTLGAEQGVWWVKVIISPYGNPRRADAAC